MNSALQVMWHRQVKEYFRNRTRVAATMMQPLLFMVAFGFGIKGMYEQTGRGSYIQYLVPGLVAMTLLMSSTMNGVSLIWDKQFGFLKETLVAPVSRTGLLFGRCLGGATTSVFQGLLTFGLGFLVGFRMPNWLMLPAAVVFMMLVSLLFNLFGTSIAAKYDDMQTFPVIMNFLVMPMVFISPAMFPAEGFPKALKIVMACNPFTYCADLVSFGLNGKCQRGLLFDLVVPGVLIVILGLLGTRFFNRMEA